LFNQTRYKRVKPRGFASNSRIGRSDRLIPGRSLPEIRIVFPDQVWKDEVVLILGEALANHYGQNKTG
jgi:hypothetical protein